MKVFIILSFFISLTSTKLIPGKWYREARSHDEDYHNTGHERLPPEYSRPCISLEDAQYIPTRRNPHALKRQKYVPSKDRVRLHQKFITSATRESTEGPQTARSLFQFTFPSAVLARPLITEYDMPDAISTPIIEHNEQEDQKPYSARVNFQNFQSENHLNRLTSTSAPQIHIDSLSNDYSEPLTRPQGLLQDYNTPGSFFKYFGSNVHITSSEIKDSLNYDSNSHAHDVPNHGDFIETSGTSTLKSRLQKYVVSRTSLMSSTEPRLGANVRSYATPHLPTTRSTAHPNKHGVAEQQQNQMDTTTGDVITPRISEDPEEEYENSTTDISTTNEDNYDR